MVTLPSLAAGTNAIGKLTANSGVDIGDVDVTSLPALPTGSNAIGTVEVTSAPTTAVTGTFWQATQNTSQVQSALYTKQYTVTSSAAQVWGASSQATASGLTVLADSANTATVHVGPSGVSATTGVPLAAGAAFTFSIDDANKIYAICATASQKLNLVAM